MIHGISERLLPIVLLMVLFGVSGCSLKHQKPVNLADYERQVFSETGEDGVIEKIFEIIEPTHKFCVEFGATDGIFYSNSRNLILNHGWSSLLIEGGGKASELAENYRGIPNVKTLQAWVWPGNVEILFEENGVPEDLDFLVIDVCSNDYYIWRAIQSFRPKVVMIEVNSFFPPPQLMVINFHPMNYWDYTVYFGASLQSLYNLAKKKGYELVYHTKDGTNAFFVDKKYFPRFGIRDNSPEKLFNPLSEKLRTIFKDTMGPDMPLIPEGKEHLKHQFKIKKKFIYDR